MKFRRHHNNKGYRQIRNGKTRRFGERMARKYVKGWKPKEVYFVDRES